MIDTVSNRQLDFKDKVVVVTGAGGGLGKAYSVFFASRGANVLINDFSKESADKAVKEINDRDGGRAIANYDSVTDGGKIIKQAVDKWGKVDILINNAGILRDKSFASMSDKEWDQIHDVHVKGAYACSHAAWPIMRKQKYGRIIMVSTAQLQLAEGLARSSLAAFLADCFRSRNLRQLWSGQLLCCQARPCWIRKDART